MKLYIKIKNNQPFEHPIIESNLLDAFPDIDVKNLPENFASFERVAIPELKIDEVFEDTTYEWDNGIVKDVHHVRPMTDEEKFEKQSNIKTAWLTDGFLSWTFDELTWRFVPPTPYPTDGNCYRWDEPTVSWIEITPELSV